MSELLIYTRLANELYPIICKHNNEYQQYCTRVREKDIDILVDRIVSDVTVCTCNSNRTKLLRRDNLIHQLLMQH